MSDRKLRIWCNQQMPDDARRRLEQAVGGHRIVFAQRSNQSNLAPGERDPIAQDCDIAFGQPSVEDVIAAQRLKWIHLSTAGYTRYDREDVRAALRARGAVLTSSSSVFADACAQHVLAMMLALARRLPQALAEQREQRWTYWPLRESSRVLTGQSALIVGVGGIGRRLAELLVPFNMILHGVRRTVRGDEPLLTGTMDQLPEWIGRFDHVINLLPSSERTRRLFNAALFARMKPGARFYNVGRGDTVDQDALMEALESGQLNAAYLDVTDPEPLPSGHPLWSTRNCFITPHTAGGRQDEYVVLVDHFLENLARHERGLPLHNRII